MPIRPELNAKKKIAALERRRALIDALIEFIRTHPESSSEGYLQPLASRTGLRYDYAEIRPMWKDNKVVLRLEKYLENWDELHPDERLSWFDGPEHRIVRDDVSKMSDKRLLTLLDKVHQELIPGDFEE